MINITFDASSYSRYTIQWQDNIQEIYTNVPLENVSGSNSNSTTTSSWWQSPPVTVWWGQSSLLFTDAPFNEYGWLPVRDTTWFDHIHNQWIPSKIRVYDSAGREILTDANFEFDWSSDQNIAVDLAPHPSGIYCFRINSPFEDGVTITQKVVKK